MARVSKFNQNHGSDGRFTGPGTSHQPTGRPVGRPETTGAARSLRGSARTRLVEGEATGRQTAQVAGGWLGSAIGDYAGSLASDATTAAGAEYGAAIGTAIMPGIGTAAGAAIGTLAGRYAPKILGSVVGDYVGTKIGTALYDLKHGTDGQPVGASTAAGELTDRDAAGIAGSMAGGWGLWGAFQGISNSLPGGALAHAAAEEALSGIGDAAGYYGGVKAYDAVHGAPGSQQTSDKGTVGKFRKFRSGGLFGSSDDPQGKPPSGYDGSFGSMASSAAPHLFGPKAWSQIKGTPFGSYVMSRVKETASKMDDAAAQQGISLKPMSEGDMQETAQLFGQQVQQHAAQQQAQQQQQMDMQAQAQAKAQAQQQGQPGQPGGGMGQGGAPGAPPKPAAPAPEPPQDFGKAFTLPFRGPNDAVARDAYQTGGPANIAFLRRMQESDRQSKLLQMQTILAQPKVENLARNPTEDEDQYHARVHALMRQSVEASDRLRPQLFTGGMNEQSNVIRMQVHKKRQAPSLATDEYEFEIHSEIIKSDALPLDKGLVWGWASVIEKDGQPIVDHQGDRISEDELTSAAHNYIAKSRQGGVLHDKFGQEIGQIVESVVMTKALQKALGIDLGKVGWLIGYKVVSPQVKLLVKSGMLKSFSIGGRGKRVPVDV